MVQRAPLPGRFLPDSPAANQHRLSPSGAEVLWRQVIQALMTQSAFLRGRAARQRLLWATLRCAAWAGTASRRTRRSGRRKAEGGRRKAEGGRPMTEADKALDWKGPVGSIVRAQGPVIDGECRRLPPPNRALMGRIAGAEHLFAVHRHLDNNHLHAIALHRTDGLGRRTPIFVTDYTLQVPGTRACSGAPQRHFRWSLSVRASARRCPARCRGPATDPHPRLLQAMTGIRRLARSTRTRRCPSRMTISAPSSWSRRTTRPRPTRIADASAGVPVSACDPMVGPWLPGPGRFHRPVAFSPARLRPNLTGSRSRRTRA
jgi:hypothetical protein